jgi:hypothetical protein
VTHVKVNGGVKRETESVWGQPFEFNRMHQAMQRYRKAWDNNDSQLHNPYSAGAGTGDLFRTEGFDERKIDSPPSRFLKTSYHFDTQQERARAFEPALKIMMEKYFTEDKENPIAIDFEVVGEQKFFDRVLPYTFDDNQEYLWRWLNGNEVEKPETNDFWGKAQKNRKEYDEKMAEQDRQPQLGWIARICAWFSRQCNSMFGGNRDREYQRVEDQNKINDEVDAAFRLSSDAWEMTS